MSNASKERPSSSYILDEIDTIEADGYVTTEQDILRRRLKKLNLFGTKFGYSAFSPNLLPLLTSTGTYHRQTELQNNFIYCCIVQKTQHAGKFEIIDSDEYDLVHYLRLTMGDSPFATFAIYDMLKLGPVPGLGANSHPAYYFIEKDKRLEALLGIIKVTGL